MEFNLSFENQNKRIAKNTLFLYFRMMLTMGVSLYTSRIVLNALGVEDFGIYNVVGGIVSMFILLNGSMAAATQRFLTFELGKNNKQKLKAIFSVSITIHHLIALVILILGETLGCWFLNTQMNIDSNRMNAANWVYQCSMMAFIVNIISVPYNAAIIAHERMKAFAYVSILEAILKLLIVFVLPLVDFDKLKLYAVLILAVSVVIRIIYGSYCKINFEESQYKFSWNRKLFVEMGSFAGWNFIGASSAILMSHGVNILLNIFCGVVVNAGRGIATKVQNVVSGFIDNFMMALNPQITKSYASGNKKYLFQLVQQSARFSYYLMLFLSLPILIEAECILKLWLNIVPNYTVIFVRLSLIYAIAQTLSKPLVTAMLATGNIKRYQIIVGGLQMMNLPFSYLALKLGSEPQSTTVIAIIFSFACLSARLWLLRGMIGLPVNDYLKNVLLNTIIVTAISIISPLIVYKTMHPGLLRLLSVCIASVLSTVIVSFFVGLSRLEREFTLQKINQYVVKARA
jgi:O-antigen/teichoic acid export membrane protein